MPSELDDLVFVSSGLADKPQGLSFDDVPMRNDIGPTAALLLALRNSGSAYFADEMAGVTAASPMAKQGGHVDGMYFHPQSLLRDLIGGGARLAAEQVAPSLFGREGGRIYDKAVAGERARSKEAEEQYPWTTLAGDVIGGLAVPVGGVLGAGANLGARVLQGTKIGALFGGISGAGRGEDLSDRAVGAVIGAPLGGGLGAALGAAAPHVLKAAEAVAKAGARAAQPLINAVRGRSAREGEVAADMRIGRMMPPASNDNTMPSRIFFHPPKARRSFEDDYPNGAKADAEALLLEDMDKQPLYHVGAVLGRRKLGGPDEPLRESNHAALATLLTLGRKGLKEVEPHEMKRPGSLGETELDTLGLPVEIRVLRTLSPEDKAAVKAHEFGKAIVAHGKELMETYIGPINQMEMRRVYNELGNPNRTEGKVAKDARPFTPAGRGYSRDEMLREYLAEAVRGYLSEPGWLKSIAPDTAQTLRQVIREHLWLSKFLTFNNIGPMMVGGAGAAGIGAAAVRDSRHREPDAENGD